MKIQWNAFAALAAAVLVLSATEARAVDQEICLRYPVETIDSGLGTDFEDHYALNDEVWPYWKSRGAAYQVLDPDTLSIIQQGYANDVNGCFTLPDEDIPAGNQVAIMFYLDALLVNESIRVRTRIGARANCNDDPFADHSGEPSYCQPIACMGMSGNLTGAGKKYFDYPCNEPEVTLQALASYPAYWWHHFAPEDLDDSFIITVRHTNGCTQPGDAPCSNAGWSPSPNLGGDEIVVNIDDTTEDKFRQKFLVAHEVGHALEESYQFDTFGTTTYLYGDDDPPAGGAACDSAGEQHALTSLERTSAAIMEGFAHFLASDAYNDHNDSTGRFTYYKDALGFPRDIALEGEPAFNMAEPWKSNRFAQRVCAPAAGNKGTELDWLRFFWDLHTVGGGADGEHLSLFKLRVDAAFQGTAWTGENGYGLLEQNVCSGEAAVQAFQDDFLDFAGSDDDLGGNGVKPTAGAPSCP